MRAGGQCTVVYKVTELKLARRDSTTAQCSGLENFGPIFFCDSHGAARPRRCCDVTTMSLGQYFTRLAERALTLLALCTIFSVDGAGVGAVNAGQRRSATLLFVFCRFVNARVLVVALAIWSTAQGQTVTELSTTPSKFVAVDWCVCGYVSVCRGMPVRTYDCECAAHRNRFQVSMTT